jgi:hypothetical protein
VMRPRKQEEGVILAQLQRFQSMAIWPHCFCAVVRQTLHYIWQKGMVGECGKISPTYVCKSNTGGGDKRVIEYEFDQSTLYAYMEISQ